MNKNKKNNKMMKMRMKIKMKKIKKVNKRMVILRNFLILWNMELQKTTLKK